MTRLHSQSNHKNKRYAKVTKITKCVVNPNGPSLLVIGTPIDHFDVRLSGEEGVFWGGGGMGRGGGTGESPQITMTSPRQGLFVNKMSFKIK